MQTGKADQDTKKIDAHLMYRTLNLHHLHDFINHQKDTHQHENRYDPVIRAFCQVSIFVSDRLTNKKIAIIGTAATFSGFSEENKFVISPNSAI